MDVRGYRLGLLFSLLLTTVVACGGGKLPSQNQESAVELWGRPPGAALQDALRCKPLRAGELRFIETANNGVGIGVRYRLSRTDGGYEALINPVFQPESNKTVQASEMYARATSCLKSLEPYMLGPEGERLVIRFATPEDKSLPLQMPIQIAAEPIHPSYSNRWSPMIRCEEILHETLHLVGLVDEYSAAAEYPCRSLGPKHSAMGSFPHAAIDGVTARYDVKSCVCEEDSPECVADLEKFSGAVSKCPDSSREEYNFFITDQDLNLNPALRSELRKLKAGKHPKEGEYRFAVRTREPARRSILLPSQFKSIVNPGCSDRNELYFRCAPNFSKPKDACGGEQIPDECRDFDWLN